MLVIVGSSLVVLGLVGWFLIVVDAFRRSWGRGLLAMAVPFYVVYYAFAEYRRPRGWAVVLLFVGGLALGGLTCQWAAMGRIEELTRPPVLPAADGG